MIKVTLKSESELDNNTFECRRGKQVKKQVLLNQNHFLLSKIVDTDEICAAIHVIKLVQMN